MRIFASFQDIDAKSSSICVVSEFDAIFAYFSLITEYASFQEIDAKKASVSKH